MTRTDPPHELLPPTARDIAEVLAAPNPGALLFTPDEWRLVTDGIKLSPREQQVAWLLVQGFPRKTIAQALHKADGWPLHLGSVHQYIRRLSDKLHARSGREVSYRLLALRRRIRWAGATI